MESQLLKSTSINELESASMDELWSLHEQVTSALLRRIPEEKAKLEGRLRRLDGTISPNTDAISPSRRPYPKVLPKYQNPRDPAERWSGRGKQPRWVRAQLKAGKKLENFLIARRSASKLAVAARH